MKKLIVILLLILIAFPQKVYGKNILKYGIAAENVLKNTSFSAFEEKCGTHDVYVFTAKNAYDIPYFEILACSAQNKIPVLTITEDCNATYLAQSLGNLDVDFTAEICPLTDACTMTATQYISYFQNTAAVFKKYAPRCKVLYSFSLENISKAKEYYPGSYYADIAGFILYVPQDDSMLNAYLLTKEAYEYFTPKTEVMFSRFAVSHYKNGASEYTSKKSAQLIKAFYDCINKEFPQILYVVYDNVIVEEKLPDRAYINDYRINTPSELSALYKAVVNTDISEK